MGAGGEQLLGEASSTMEEPRPTRRRRHKRHRHQSRDLEEDGLREKQDDKEDGMR